MNDMFPSRFGRQKDNSMGYEEGNPVVQPPAPSAHHRLRDVNRCDEDGSPPSREPTPSYRLPPQHPCHIRQDASVRRTRQRS